MRKPHVVLGWVAILAFVSCRDVAGPSFSLSIAGPPQVMLTHIRFDDGSAGTACDVELEVHATGGNADEAIWTRAIFAWRRAFSTTVLQVDTLSAAEVTDFWGGSVLPSSPRVAAWRFSASEPFAIDMVFEYRVASRADVGSYTLLCQPPAPLPLGTFRLENVNGEGLPRPVAQWDYVHAATLTFYPNMTYTFSSRVQAGSQVYDVPSGIPEFYSMPTSDSIEISTIAFGTAGGRLHRSANYFTFFQANCCGRPDYTWFYVQ